MHFDIWQAVAGIGVGTLVGLTGMGGGALLTPLLILVFGVNPGSAVSSDLLTSLVMRPVGALVHGRRGTVSWPIVRWLVVGSIPAGFAGSVIIHSFGSGPAAAQRVQLGIGAALLLAFAGILARSVVSRRGSADGMRQDLRNEIRPVVTVGIGVLGGLMVGMTSVGSGSLMMVLLMLAYPRLGTRELVGTDLVQAVPLIAAATLGHTFFGHINFGITFSLLIGSIPGVYLGARISSNTTGRVIRPMLAVVLLATGLRLLGVSYFTVLASVPAAVLSGLLVWRLTGLTSWLDRVAIRGRGGEVATLGTQGVGISR